MSRSHNELKAWDKTIIFAVCHCKRPFGANWRAVKSRPHIHQLFCSNQQQSHTRNDRGQTRQTKEERYRCHIMMALHPVVLDEHYFEINIDLYHKTFYNTAIIVLWCFVCLYVLSLLFLQSLSALWFGYLTHNTCVILYTNP